MKWTSALAIYILFWTLAAFLVMPFGVRTHSEMGLDLTPGQAHSAPGNFNPRKLVIRTTILATLMFVPYYENYIHQWITVADLDFSRWFGL